MNWHSIKRSDFDRIFKQYAEICNKPISDGIISFYYEELKNIPLRSLQAGVNIYAIRGHFATVGELLKECGYSQPLTQEERDQIIEKKNETKTEEPTVYYPNIIYVMQLKSKELTKEAAHLDFEKQKEKLAKDGWHIGNVILDDTSIEEIVDGNRKKRINLFVQNFNCHKEK